MPVTPATARLRIALGPQKKAALLNVAGPDAGAVQSALQDAQLAFDGDTLMVGYTYRQLVNIHPKLRVHIDVRSLTDAMKHATDLYKREVDEALTKARKDCRTSSDTFVEPKEPAFDPDADAAKASKEILKDAPGLGISRDHKDADSMKGMMDMVTDDGTDIKLLFLEEFRAEDQDAMNAYLSSAPEDPMPPALAKRISDLKGQFSVDWEPILAKARAKKMKVFGIDSAMCEPGVETTDPNYGERRVAVMNTFAADIMKKAMTENPGEKFMAVCGSAHMSTHPGGILGLPQIMGMPAVTVGTGGRLSIVRDDKAQRGMPNELELAFVDAAMTAAGKEFDAMSDKGSAKIDDRDLRPDIVKLAKNFITEDRLKQPSDVAGLVGDTETKKVIAACLQRTKTRAVRLTKIDTAIDGEDTKALTDLIAEDPNILRIVDKVNGNLTLLHKALAGNKPKSAELLLAKGSDPNAPDVKGNTPAHVAARSITDPKAASELLIDLAYGGSDMALRGPDGLTPVDLALQRGDTYVASKLIEEGHGKIEDLYVRDFMAKAREEYSDRNPKVHDDFDTGELDNLARSRFAKMAAVTRLVEPSDIAEVMNVDEVSDDAIADLIKRTKARRARKQEMSAAIDTDDDATVLRILKEDPLFASLELDQARTVLTTVALKGKNVLLGKLVDAGVDANQVSSRGRTTLHELAVYEAPKSDKATHGRLAGSAAVLVGKGADVNAVNGIGQTALHLAGFRNNADMIKALPGADATIRDKRGWTAMDMTLGSTCVEAEQAFYEKGLATKKPPLTDGQHSSIDILCGATHCNAPSDDELKVRKMFEALYAVPELRPIVDLAAASACNDRNPPKGGLRIFANNGNNVGTLFGKSMGPSGAYDEKANSLLICTKSDKLEGDPKGTLAHELTHMTAHLVSDDEQTLPFTNSKEKAEYLKAIEDDMRKLESLNESDPAQAFVKERISGRMADYNKKKGSETDFSGADLRLLQEHIVSVPQLIATYGVDYVREHVPNMFKFFTDFAAKAKTTLDTDPRFAEGRARIDPVKNSRLVQRLTTENAGPKPPEKTVLTPDDACFTPTAIIDKLRADVKARTGTVVATPGGGPSVLSGPGDFKLNPKAEKALEAKLAVLQKALVRTMAKDRMARDIAADQFPSLIESLSGAITSDKSDRDLAKAGLLLSDTWNRKQKIERIKDRIARGNGVSARDLAEASVLEAELMARGGSSNDDEWVAAALDTSDSKHIMAVTALKEELEKDENKRLLATDPATLLRVLPIAALNPKAIRVKPKRFGAPSKHVSIDVESTRREWVEALRHARA
jgi:ankyrin repeat protein